MKKIFAVMFAALASFAVVGSPASAQMMDGGMKSNNPMVGGAAMYRSKTIVENALNSPIHTTLVAAVKAAGLVGTLSGKGPFTVFAPTNDAFDKLPAGTVGTLVMPENKATLAKILTYHVVAGKYDSKKIARMIRKGKGTETFTTVSGGKLMARMSGNSLVLTDEKGGTSTVTTADVYQSNGVIHVIDTVVMPN
ncbi:MAG: fasciclin domain-containing protein [Pyrinomonadaceae bacterium]